MAPQIDERIRIHEDSEGAIKVAKSRLSSQRTRHVDVKHHIVRDAFEGGIVCVEHVCSEEQNSNILTKVLDVNNLETQARFLLNSP